MKLHRLALGAETDAKPVPIEHFGGGLECAEDIERATSQRVVQQQQQPRPEPDE